MYFFSVLFFGTCQKNKSVQNIDRCFFCERKMLGKFLLYAFFAMASVAKAAENFNVVDGDSLEAGSERLRLMNIDAPEFFQKCYDASGWKYLCGFEATEHLKRLMQGQVRCERYGKDRYGRSLVECWRADGMNIGQEMVRSGAVPALSMSNQIDRSVTPFFAASAFLR